MDSPLLAVRRLTVAFAGNKVVDDISFSVASGETFALVGATGSGKSITAASVLRLLPSNAQVTVDAITLSGSNISALAEIDFCKIRGRRIGFVFQDPLAALNPVMTVGKQILEARRLHFAGNNKEHQTQVLQLLQQVQMPQPSVIADKYPHQLSGGQRQRVMIAMALAGKPDLLIADEPTTALDVTTQAQILQLLKSIQAQTQMGLLLISHDLALVATVADTIAVMRCGVVVETASAASFFAAASHSYSRKLLADLPNMDNPKQATNPTPALLEVNDLKVYYPIQKGLFKRTVGYVRAVDGISFALQRGKTLALVGESGCGKTTLGRALVRLVPVYSGGILLHGRDILRLRGEQLRQMRTAVQIIFQDPYGAMNPRMLVGDIIQEGLRALHPNSRESDRRQRVLQLLQQVELSPQVVACYPHEFSGGQRQRICIARALALEPQLIICDEPTSSLDVSIQAQIIALLKNIQQSNGVSYLFISHDFAVVSEIADDIAVMQHGKIVELAPCQQILNTPSHSYTKQLLAAVPRLLPRSER